MVCCAVDENVIRAGPSSCPLDYRLVQILQPHFSDDAGLSSPKTSGQWTVLTSGVSEIP